MFDYDWHVATERSGFYQFDEERTYEGDWVLGKMHGKGTQVFLHSSQYKGDFKENMKYGKGVMVWDGGEMYNGDWQDDKPRTYSLTKSNIID